MRVAFSIIFNGLHHLEHKDQYRQILDNCDKWVVVEGASRSNGSTQWCKEMPDEYHNNGASVDGTREFLEKLAEEEYEVSMTSEGFYELSECDVKDCNAVGKCEKNLCKNK